MKTAIKPVKVNGVSLVSQMVKNPSAMWETCVQSLGQEDPLQVGMQPTPVFLPGKFHGQSSLVGFSPWDHIELDTTEQLSTRAVKLKL